MYLYVCVRACCFRCCYIFVVGLVLVLGILAKKKKTDIVNVLLLNTDEMLAFSTLTKLIHSMGDC